MNQSRSLTVAQDDEKTVRKFLREHPLPVPIYLAAKDPPADLRLWGVPTTFILDRNGATVFRHVGGANWDDDGARNFIRGWAAR